MKYTSEVFWRCIVLGVTIVWLFLLYGNVLLHPDSYMFSSAGDGIKNYFTFAWHVRYDPEWLHFGGMNIPYGEHVCYTDGHPLFSLFFGWIPWVKNHPVGFLNLFMLFSFLITSLVLFEVLRELRVVPWIAAIGALCINWMQPQIFRIEGHFALSYAWAIPLVILIVLRWTKSPGLWKLVQISLVIFGLFMIHPYLGMITATMVFAWSFGYLMMMLRKWRESAKNALYLLFACMIPVAGYYFFIKLTDTHAGRSAIAKGFLDYTSSFEDVFVPNHPPFRHLISQVIRVRGQEWEGWAYIGLATILLIIFMVIMIILKKWKKEESFNKVIIFWVASLPILFFSFGFPFDNLWKEGLDVIPFIQQFRAPGRFAWVFYYAATITAVYGLFIITEHYPLFRSRVAKWMLVGGFAILFFAEGYVTQVSVAMRTQQSGNVFDWDHPETNFSAVSSMMKPEPAQKGSVLVPLPFFHYGSDFLGRKGTEKIQQLAYACAFQTGIPLMASANPRVSLSESASILHFFDASNEGDVLDDLKSKGIEHVFTLWSGETLLPEEWRIKNSGETVINANNIFAGMESLEHIIHSAKSEGGFLEAIKNWDQQVPFSPEIESELEMGKFLTVAAFNELKAEPGDSLMASVWVRIEKNNSGNGLMAFVQERKQDGSILWINRKEASESFHLYPDHVQLIVPFVAPSRESVIEIALTNNDTIPCSLIVTGAAAGKMPLNKKGSYHKE